MIRFFRSIRKTLLFQDKTIRYFQYAIGEIVLVVIGILIALQINNWNEARKTDRKARAVMAEVKNDLEYSISIADLAIAVYEEKDSLLSNVLEGNVTADDYMNNSAYRNVLSRGFNMAVTKNGFEKLIAMSGDFNEDYGELISRLKLHYGYRSDIMLESYSNVKEITREIYKRYSETYSWYATFISDPDEAYIEYCLNDPLYQNEIRRFQSSSVGSYLNRIYIYRFSAIHSYLDLYAQLQSRDTIPEYISYLQVSDKSTLDRIKGRYVRGQESIQFNYDLDILYMTDESGDYYMIMQLSGRELEFEDMKGRRLKFGINQNGDVDRLMTKVSGEEVVEWVRD